MTFPYSAQEAPSSIPFFTLQHQHQHLAHGDSDDGRPSTIHHRLGAAPAGIYCTGSSSAVLYRRRVQHRSLGGYPLVHRLSLSLAFSLDPVHRSALSFFRFLFFFPRFFAFSSPVQPHHPSSQETGKDGHARTDSAANRDDPTLPCHISPRLALHYPHTRRYRPAIRTDA